MGHSTGHDDTTAEETPEDHWEARYNDTGEKDRIWSGRVNATTADVAATLTPGRALDLGCGEGGDAVWLAEQGWQVTAVDISPTATTRGAEAAAERGLTDSITWVAHDLATWDPGTESFDLVTASFFHSMVELDRTAILRRAAAAITPGGHLLIVSHAAFPPWSKAAQEHDHEHDHGHESGGHHHHDFLTPDGEIAELALPAGQWETVLTETRTREATGPDGTQAPLDDGVVLLRRS